MPDSRSSPIPEHAAGAGRTRHPWGHSEVLLCEPWALGALLTALEAHKTKQSFFSKPALEVVQTPISCLLSPACSFLDVSGLPPINPEWSITLQKDSGTEPSTPVIGFTYAHTQGTARFRWLSPPQSSTAPERTDVSKKTATFTKSLLSARSCVGCFKYSPLCYNRKSKPPPPKITLLCKIMQ